MVVELDSVALFERADGTPHVIGPTGNKLGGKETLEGFERFREALDIRDHYVDLRDQNERSKAVEGLYALPSLFLIDQLLRMVKANPS